MTPPAPRRHLSTSPFNEHRQAAEAAAAGESFEVGDRVTDDRHGLGRVTKIEGDVAVHVDFGSGPRRVALPASRLHRL
jgi:hypothetical protein